MNFFDASTTAHLFIPQEQQSQPYPANSIVRLPIDGWDHVFEHLEEKNYRSLRAVCKLFRSTGFITRLPKCQTWLAAMADRAISNMFLSKGELALKGLTCGYESQADISSCFSGITVLIGAITAYLIENIYPDRPYTRFLTSKITTKMVLNPAIAEEELTDELKTSVRQFNFSEDLNIDEGAMSETYIRKILHLFPNIETISFEGKNISDRVITVVCTPKLKKLSINSAASKTCRVTGSCFSSFPSTLTNLTCHNCPLDNEAIELAKRFEKLKIEIDGNDVRQQDPSISKRKINKSDS